MLIGTCRDVYLFAFIKEAKDYPENYVCGALKAEVVTPKGRSIQVFIVHFMPPTKPAEEEPEPLKNVPSNEIYDHKVSFLVEKLSCIQAVPLY